jgi:TRAP-type transport system periplasmic protein
VSYLIGSAEIGIKVLNDPALRATYLEAEHKGVKVLLLFTTQPWNEHTTHKAIRLRDDLRGLCIRFASPTIRDFVAALGATPVAVPPNEQGEQLQKGTIDGVCIDYGGAGIAFKMGGIVNYSTEIYAYVSSFGLAMNEDFWTRLPPDLKSLVMQSVTGVETKLGQAWDASDSPSKQALMGGGARGVPQDRRGG